MNSRKYIEDGLAAQLDGNIKEADRHYRHALKMEPSNADAWHLSGAVAHTLGNLSDARKKVEQALQLEPDFPEALNTLGSILKDQKEFYAAVDAYSRAMKSKGGFAEIFANRGDVYRLVGELEAAEADCQEAVHLKPCLSTAHGNLAAVLMDRKDWTGAELVLREAIRLDPEEVVFIINLSKTLVELRRSEEALDAAVAAVNLRPTSADALNALGNAHYERGDYAAAEKYYGKVLAARPNHPDAHGNLGNTLARQNRFEEAEESINCSLSINPKKIDALTNLGGVLQAQGRLTEAFEKFEEALKLDPNYSDGHFNHGLARLLTGDLVGGFEDYEWRWRLPEFTVRHRDIPPWEGQSLVGNSILVHSEQGYGDTLQFVRYVPMLADQGARVLLETHEPLTRLLGKVDGVHEVIAHGVGPVSADFQVPIMSLAHRFGTTLDQIPASVPYVSVPPVSVIDVGPVGKTIIGLAWAGRSTHKNDANRSLEVASLKPLLDMTDIAWISLQIDSRQNESAIWAQGSIRDIRDQIKDFADTATAIAAMDLVISVDTAVAHLAGALGMPVWVLLPFAPDWRWLLDRDDSPWYPTMKLFRQETPGDWEGVIKRVAEELPSLD